MSKQESIEVKETIEEVIEEEIVEEVIERPYTLRKLKDTDLCPLLKLLRDVGVKEVKNAINKKVEEGQAINTDDIKKIGSLIIFDMVDFLIDNIESHYDEIAAFWSELSGIPVDEIKEMEFGTLPLMIYDSFSEVKNTAFFKVLSKLL